MPRVLLVCIPADAEAPAFGSAVRALRDAGHEVVHGGALGSADLIATVASQEDVDVVVLIGDAEADGIAAELPAGDDEPAVRVVRPGGPRDDVLAAAGG